ncbi:MAG: hypothetical protein PHP07_04585 [Eubacteriales bacterium]|jgi:hypothetical protein|nr:hypothetical protein [Eubacteriales bacterium]MDD3572213.1 hypothetical protein [Eubacteriales bacterium]MDD4134164.1 hypothetical protein [Eubacteriales bacterium]NLO12694.1 hypothetical protein [Clostridiales bacterium]
MLICLPARPFGQPINIQKAFGEDRKIILCPNNRADYDAAKSGLAPFVPEQHRAFMQNLMPLLDWRYPRITKPCFTTRFSSLPGTNTSLTLFRGANL